MSEYSTSKRVQQHRPDSAADIIIPNALLAQLTAGAPVIREAAMAAAIESPKAINIVCREVDHMLNATTPEQRVRNVSQITGALREATFMDKRDSESCKVFLHVLAKHFILPLLLSCAVRYLHRALATLIRTVYIKDDMLESQFRESFITTHISCWNSDKLKRPTILGDDSETLMNNAEKLLQLKDTVMSWVNCIDSTSVVALPIFPSVFADTFFDVFPLLGDSLQWMVTNARMGCRQAEVIETGNMDNGNNNSTLLGEDLAYVRYGIRVVTTYIHKFLYLFENIWTSNNTEKINIIQEDLTRLLSPALDMLSSSLFPKDVLNGAGLLVSSLLTLRTCSPWLLLEVCKQCGTTEMRTSTVKIVDSVCSQTGLEVEKSKNERVKEFVQLLCSSDPKCILTENPETLMTLQIIFSAFTNNGRFALMKGLLAHLSTPIHGNVESLGVLLKPIIPLTNNNNDKDNDNNSNNSSSSKAIVAVHDIIMPAVEAYSSALQSPDTRFMAIQTIDSVVRHIESVLSCIADILEVPSNENMNNITKTKVAKRSLQRAGGKEPLLESQKRELIELCIKTPKLTRTLNQATEVIMGMWDDNTQQVAGPLYDTYNEILAVHCMLKRCSVLTVSNCIENNNTNEEIFDTAETVQSILSIPDERRGKYHALLGLISVVPMIQFLSELRKYYSHENGTISDIQSLCYFSKLLISGAGNHKIGNIAGDVFAKMAGRILKLNDKDVNDNDFFMKGIIKPLVESLLIPGYASFFHLNEAAEVSHIVTHIISPCLKSEEIYLPTLLSQLGNVLSSEKNSSRVNQSVVEIIHRARLVGRDVSTYIHPNSQSFKAVLASLQSQESELRFTALGLCVLSTKKSESVELWQCRMMEWYLSTNMHYGGDSAALRNLLELYKKWTRRFVDSYMKQETRQRKGLEESEKAETYKQLVINHCIRTVNCIIPQIGENAKWCRNLSLERRVAAMSVYTCLIRSVLEFLSPIQLKNMNLTMKLFPSVLVEGLLECLSEGWEKARTSAYSILLLYCEYAPETVFVSQYLGDMETANTAKRELLRAQTFRKAEGEVLRYVLASYFTPVAREAAISDPLQESKRRVEFVEREIAIVQEKFVLLQSLGVKGAYEYIQEHPLHGSLSLCSALLSNAWEVKHDTEFFYEVCNKLLICSREALQTCSLLVGGGESSTTNDGNEADVDCRGHIFDRDGTCTEKTMRTVVNNTWLSIRTSAAAIVRIIKLVSVDHLSFPIVRSVCYVLMESLLRTKHNGVMRAVRQALKTIAAALLRSRTAVFYSLPAEMLEFLLGPDGVTSRSVARMLRRSQGLPHALLALLEAEDPTVPVVLFAKAMRALLRVAAGTDINCIHHHTNSNNNNNTKNKNTGNGEEVETGEEGVSVSDSQRSNALNVLKFIFENKIFASRSVASLEEAFWIATSGFDDESWGIRNSSLMLFSAVLPRFVGEHPSTGGVGVNTSLHDIAVRAPRGVAFTYDVLVKSCANPIPSLGVFPLLQMLSMLSPDPPHLITKATVKVTTGNENNMDADSSRIIRAVVQCGSSRNLMIRAASAVALSSLVPPSHLESMMMEFFSTISDVKSDANAIHGALLHMQQFHTFYVGTLRRNMRIKVMSSNATTSVAKLISKLTIQGLTSLSVASKLHHISVKCPTIAATFLSLACDTLYFYNQRFGNCGDNSLCLELTRIGVGIVYELSCVPTEFFNISCGDHTLVEQNAALFALLSVGFLAQKSEEITVLTEKTGSIWKSLSCIFTGKKGDSLISYFMDHISYYTTEKRWTREIAQNTLQLFKTQVHYDPTHAALFMLTQELSVNTSHEQLPCTGVFHMKAHLEFLVMLGVDTHLKTGELKQLCDTVESLLLQRMDPQTNYPLRNTEVQSWAVRFLARCCVRRGTCSEEFLRVLSHHSSPVFNVQNRAAVVAALNDGLLSIHGNTNTNSMNHHCVFLLILLRLLFDDAHEVRTDACRVASTLTSPVPCVYDHSTCVFSLIYQLRQYSKGGVLSFEVVRQYLMGGDIVSEEETDDKNDGDEEVCEEEDGEEDVLFEKEADNMFAEESMLEYLVGVIMQGTRGDDNNNNNSTSRSSGPTFAVCDELIGVTEKRGSAALLYATLFDKTN